MSRFACTLLLLFPVTGAVLPQEEPRDRTPKVTGGGITVLIDAVVLDGSNRIDKTLQVEDFEILEDGVQQAIDSCRLMVVGTGSSVTGDRPNERPQGAGLEARGSGQAPAELLHATPRRLMVLLLDYTTADVTGQNLIDRACQKFIDSDLSENDLVAVFSLGPGFKLLADFTSDKQKLKQAIARRRLAGVSIGRADAKTLKNLLFDPGFGAAQAPPPSRASAALSGAADDDSGHQLLRLMGSGTFTARGSVEYGGMHLQRLINSYLLMLNHSQVRQAHEHLAALRAICDGLVNLEGRKGIVFFTRGFVIDSMTEGVLHQTIATANRSGVAIYPIDPQGLETRGTSSSLVPRGELDYIGSAHQGADARGGQSVFERARTAGTDIYDSLLRYLGAETGGFAVRNTNDLYSGLARVGDEMSAYYLLTYRPRRQDHDGLFHQVSVRVRKPGLQIRHRPGYVAAPAGYETLTSDEIRLIQAAQRSSGPAWPVYLKADVFHPLNLGPNVLLTADVPSSQILFLPGEREKKKTNQASLYLVGLLRDETGSVLQRFGEPVNFHFDEKQFNQIRNGRLSFTYEFSLLPGLYSFVLYAQDRNAPQNHAVVESSILLEPYSEELRLSSVVIGTHAQRTREAQLQATGGIKLSPSAELRFRQAEKAVLYFRVYNSQLDSQGFSDLDVTVTLNRAGSKYALPVRPVRIAERPTDNGLPVMRYLELTSVPPGAYFVDVEARDNLSHDTARGRARITVVAAQ